MEKLILERVDGLRGTGHHGCDMAITTKEKRLIYGILYEVGPNGLKSLGEDNFEVVANLIIHSQELFDLCKELLTLIEINMPGRYTETLNKTKSLIGKIS